MYRLLRRLFLSDPGMSHNDAVDIARRAAAEVGLVLDEPLAVRDKLRQVVVHGGADLRPGGPWVTIDVRSGEVLDVSQPTR